jgi:hypothetical protein
MEYIEKVDIRAVDWLLSKLSVEFILTHKTKKDDDIKFTTIKRVLQGFSKNKGMNKAFYKKGKNDKHGLYRDYSEGIQSLPSRFRGILCKGMTDIDCVNCFPSILLNICRLHDITCPYLEKYVNERDELIKNGITSKDQVICMLNSKNKLKNYMSPFNETFDVEIKQIQKALVDNELYTKQLEDASHNLKNKIGSFMYNIGATYEAIILQHLIQFFKEKNIQIGVLMFDGIMVYGEIGENIISEMSEYIRRVMNFNLKYKIKPFNNGDLVIPSDWTSTDHEQIYRDFKEKYENDYKLSFIRASTMYSYKINNDIKFFTMSDIHRQFDNVMIGKNNFFDLWNKDEDKLIYDDIGVYPHDTTCPDGILNLWTGFAVEKYENPQIVDTSPIYNHLRHLFDDIEVNFILLWISNMFQFPSSRSIMLCINGNQGTGKTCFIEFLNNIIGSSKTISITNPETELFGNFNGHLSSKVLINLNEVSRKNMCAFYDAIKPLITEKDITIHNKGLKAYKEQNLGRYVLTTNNDNVMDIKENDRRYFPCETKDVLRGDTEYFNNFYKCINDKNIQYSFFKEMMSYTTKRTITIKDIPITETMNKAYEYNKDNVEEYVSVFVGEKDAQTNYTDFKIWCGRQGISCDKITKKSFDFKFNKYITKYGVEKVKCDYIEGGERITIKYTKGLLLK